jgi:hypothetical protein
MTTNRRARRSKARAPNEIMPICHYRVAVYGRSANESQAQPSSHVSTQIVELTTLCEQRG